MELTDLQAYVEYGSTLMDENELRYPSMCHLLKEEGERFTEEDLLNDHSIDSSYKAPGRCFHNCQKIAINQWGKWKYFEGIALNEIPIHHAWLVHVPTGKVFDPTWHFNEQMPIEPEYIGVEIDLNFILLFHSSEGRTCSILNSYNSQPKFWFLMIPYNSEIKHYKQCLKMPSQRSTV